MKKHLPNLLTCCNLLCGAMGILYMLDPGTSGLLNQSIGAWGFAGYYGLAPAYFVWAACVFDFFDGFAARTLHVSSPIGKELDSLADMVSFGLLPAVFMFTLLRIQLHEFAIEGAWLPFAGLIIAVFSALRLAIFNVDETQRDSFKGLPTPANAIFITAIPFLPFEIHPYLLLVIAVVFSLLLVSRIDLFALKFKNFSWSDNKLKFTFLALAVLIILIFKMAGIPMIIIMYILLSLANKLLTKAT